MTTTFPHQHTAHCESGVMSTLLQQHGIDWNEAMVFGMGSGITFAYIPLIKLAGQPLISYRTPPRTIIKNTCRFLNLRLEMQKFRDTDAGMAALDEALARGELVGLQTSVFWLPYFPEAMRFHFNAHNLLVYGKDGDDYLISDPVFETVQRCDTASLRRARFAKGALAAKGLMYRVNAASATRAAGEWEGKLAHLARQALHKTIRQMQAPLFFVGTRGIHTVANRIGNLGKWRDEVQRQLYLGHIVRMQEEIGTGGAGFRYIYAYFLEQLGERLDHDDLRHAAQQLTDIGDEWRLFASRCVRQCRKPKPEGYAEIADVLHDIAEKEATLWKNLKMVAKGL